MKTYSRGPSRRQFLKAGAGLAIAAAAGPVRAATPLNEFRLVAAEARVSLVGRDHPDTTVWAYDGHVPGPEIRVRQGDRLRVTVENRLAEETTVHWHGLRVPNAMDGVPHLTQPPVAPGGSFVYEFDVPDAGTYWYHPHHRSFEQVGRGLYGPLIVEEREPFQVDDDLTWVLDDWRLLPDAQISGDFNNLHDISHNGRLGNTATLNGRVLDAVGVRSGSRVRLRLINAANARIFGLEFEGYDPWVIALDGQPVEPHQPEGGLVVLGPAMRADLILDAAPEPGRRTSVNDRFYRGLEYRLVDLVCEGTPLRDGPLDPPAALAPNTMPEPDLALAERHEIVFAGGMMGGMVSGMMGGRRMEMREMMRHGVAWTVNGVAADGHPADPLVALSQGRTCVLALVNDTAWHHPMHLHGHAFRVISRNGTPTRRREWQDTVLMNPRERVEIAFVADNPGDWMFHCHILEHQAGGMTGLIRVT